MQTTPLLNIATSTTDVHIKRIGVPMAVRLLIVDDSEPIRTSLRGLLERVQGVAHIEEAATRPKPCKACSKTPRTGGAGSAPARRPWHADHWRTEATRNGSRHKHMRELRTQQGGKPLRTLYAFDPRRAAILLIGGDKTGSDRWHDIHIPLADQLYDQHSAQLRKEGLIDG